MTPMLDLGNDGRAAPRRVTGLDRKQAIQFFEFEMPDRLSEPDLPRRRDRRRSDAMTD
jgi:hypothetical protein